MVLERDRGAAPPTRQRMTWHTISQEGFVWDWSARSEPEATWELVWRLRYDRA